MEDTPALGAVGRARASVEALRVLADMRSQARTVATAPERATLAGWSGWGPLAPMFAPKDDTWVGIAGEVAALLPEPDVAMGHRGTYNAFYTPRAVAAAMWKILAGLGFTGGDVLEPGCGGGVFMATAPDGAQMVGVERDPTAAAICQAVHPQARVMLGELQSTPLGSGFAAAIGNVPFGDVEVFDPGAPEGVCRSLHNYFIWRAVSALAPGGVAVLLTSRYTMDAHVALAREQIGRLADFLGAVRLPGGALGGGTEISADVLIMRRKVDTDTRGHGWDDAPYNHDLGAYVNGWFTDRPEMVLGTMVRGRTSQYGLGLLVEGDRAAAVPLAQRGMDLVREARERGLGWVAPLDVTTLDGPAGGGRLPDGWHEGTIRVRPDGSVVKVDGGRVVPVARPGRELLALLALRDLAVQLVTAEADHGRPDESIAPVRRACADAYRAYVARFGYLNRSSVSEGPVDEESGLPTYRRTTPRMGGFRDDPDAALVFALEVYEDGADGVEGTGMPAPILTSRQNKATVRPHRTDDPAQALAWCLDRRAGRVDVDYIAALLHRDVADVPALLGDAVYEDPGTREWLSAEEYLSGNVRDKLRTAQRAAGADGRFDRNVAALTAALPKWLEPGEITANLGAPWIATEHVEKWINTILGANPRATVRRLAATNQWEVDVHVSARESVAATAEWGTVDVDAYRLINLALNGQIPTVYVVVGYTEDGKEIRRKDPERSMLAADKQQRLREHFGEWVWSDPARARDLCLIYNERFNALAPRRFDGSNITVDGLAPWFTPYPHQLDFVARAMVTPAALCGHPVGGGKTATMAMTAMKLRQSHLVNKPMIVVPNHLIEQVTREIRQLFPAARILSASAGAIAANRRAFTARCATGDWDLVITTHSAFNRMDVAPDTERAYLEVMADALRESIRLASPKGRLTGRMVKGAAKQLDGLMARIGHLRQLAAGRDYGVTFEQLGVDYVLLDEAHYYKNLALPCRTDGFTVRPSKRATDLDVKLRWLAGRGSGRYAALLTGTPVSNTMLELYVMLHYLMPEHLERVGLGSADAWAATYVQFLTTVEVTIDGGQFQLKTRPQLFVNAPELRMLMSQVADIRTADQIGLKRPRGIWHTIVVAPTTAQQQYSTALVARAEAIKENFRKALPDNMLAVCGDGRRMATDPRLVGVADPEPGKLDRAADLIAATWREHPDQVQIVFCDVGTPNKDNGAQTYGRLRSLLTDRGMDGRRVRFIHDADNDGARAALFAACRSGQVSVIVGSTDKLGVGTNIQDRVVGMHHIDAPFRPADVEQRDGRGLRPGNRHASVAVYRYVTERTFDAYMWQMLTRKAGFIAQIMTGTVDRTVEDVGGDVVLSFAAVKAAATGQPLLLEKAEVDAKVKKLRAMQRSHLSTAARLRADIPYHRQTITAATAEADAWQAIAEQVSELTEADEAALVAAMGTFGWRSRPVTIAGLSVTFGEWRTPGVEDKAGDRHPELQVRAGRHEPVTRLFYTFWEPPRILREFRDVLHTATVRPATLRAKADNAREQIRAAEEMIARPFEQADELAAALARLDQIEQAMHAAATGKDTDAPIVGSATVADPVPGAAEVLAATTGRLDAIAVTLDPAADGTGLDGDDLVNLDDMLDDVLAALEAEVAAELEDAFGDLLV